MIEEEIKSNYWKYSYIFENNLPKTPGKLLKLMVNQLTSGYGGEISYISINKNKGKIVIILVINYFMNNIGDILVFIKIIKMNLNRLKSKNRNKNYYIFKIFFYI